MPLSEKLKAASYTRHSSIFLWAGNSAYTASIQPVITTKGSKRGPKVPPSPASATLVDGKTYEEDWIPEHLLRQRNTRTKGSSGATSGEESEGGPKARKGKGKK